MTWHPITCQEREALVDKLGRSYGGFSKASGVGVLSSKTDLDGAYGPPEVFTEWGYDYDRPVLRDFRWPGGSGSCAHYEHRPDTPDESPDEHGEHTGA